MLNGLDLLTVVFPVPVGPITLERKERGKKITPIWESKRLALYKPTQNHPENMDELGGKCSKWITLP